MKWHEVDYLAHGLAAMVVVGTRWADGVVLSKPRLTRHRGIIDCPDFDSIPRLVGYDRSEQALPGDALVIVDPFL